MNFICTYNKIKHFKLRQFEEECSMNNEVIERAEIAQIELRSQKDLRPERVLRNSRRLKVYTGQRNEETNNITIYRAPVGVQKKFCPILPQRVIGPNS